MTPGKYSYFRDRHPPLPRKSVSHNGGVDAEGICSCKQGHRSGGHKIGVYLKGPATITWTLYTGILRPVTEDVRDRKCKRDRMHRRWLRDELAIGQEIIADPKDMCSLGPTNNQQGYKDLSPSIVRICPYLCEYRVISSKNPGQLGPSSQAAAPQQHCTCSLPDLHKHKLPRARSSF